MEIVTSFIRLLAIAYILFPASVRAQDMKEIDTIKLHLNLKMQPIIQSRWENQSKEVRCSGDMHLCIGNNKVPAQQVSRVLSSIGDSVIDYPIDMVEVRMVIDVMGDNHLLKSVSICNGGMYLIDDGADKTVYCENAALVEFQNFFFSSRLLNYIKTGILLD